MRPEIPCALILILTLAVAPTMGASFQGLGDFAGGDFDSLAQSVSADGSVIAGYGTTASGIQAFRWTAATGMVSLGNLPDGSLVMSAAYDVSADGTTVVGSGDPGGGWDTHKGWRWTQSTGMIAMGSLNGAARSEAFGVSTDGSVIVGDGGQQAFRWTQSTGMVGLGYLAGYPYSRLVASSADCSVAAGSGYNASWTLEQSFRWTQAGGIVSLGNFSGGGYNFPNAMSPDGTVIAGTGHDSTGYPAYRWTQSTGMVRLGQLAGKTTTHPLGVTNNGAIIVGGAYANSDQTTCRAFIWDSGHGIRDLKTVLQSEYGIDLTGWTLTVAYGITPDGSVIVGQGTNPSGQLEAFRAVLTPDLNYRAVHSFGTGTSDGTAPLGEPLMYNGKLYGTTAAGGTSTYGTIFRVNPDGSGYEVLHTFAGPTADGSKPFGELVESGGVLYGMASAEQASQGGSIFKLNSDGSGFQVLRSLSLSDGMWPYGSLSVDGSTLYGQCTYGGRASGYSGSGTIFKIGTSGSGFQVLRTFTGGSTDGGAPHGSLTQVGTVLYGTTLYGGTAGTGTLFKVNTDGTGFQILRSFTGGSGNGRSPNSGRVTVSGSKIYGAARNGGAQDNGLVYSINTDGTGFQILHTFTGGSDGGWAFGQPVLVGPILYGMTNRGGSTDNGTIYQVGTDGSGFRVLHDFTGADGGAPYGSPIVSASTLYGLVAGGGANGSGVLFAMDLPAPDVSVPTPDPMTWSVAPYASGYHAISMTATGAIDESGVQYLFTCTSGPGHSSNWQTSPIYVDIGLAEGATCTYTVTARDAGPYHNMTAASDAASATTQVDTITPTPSPMTWSTPPRGASLYAIYMVASTASDLSGVQYYFTCTSGPGHDSGWQDGTSYYDNGLPEGSTCTYTVKVRDRSLAANETAPSEAVTASTNPDVVGPVPAKMTWDVAPRVVSAGSITMTATTAFDEFGVQYYFANVTDPNHDSGWRDSSTWTDTGLLKQTTYTYRVIARDKSSRYNENAWSDPNSATTPQYLCTTPVAHDLNSDCRVDFMDLALLASAYSTPLPLTNDIAVNGTFTDGIAGWTAIDMAAATGTLMADWDAPFGNPPGAAYLMCDLSGGDVDGHFLCQVLPVTPGNRYKLSGQWTGDMTIVAGTETTWANIVVTFEAGTDPAGWHLTEPDALMYRKALGSTLQNIDPNGIWGWEEFTSSPASGPADGIFTATDNYMVVAFSLAGLASSTLPWFDIDNIRLDGPGCPVLDLNGDCSTDMADLATFAGEWLACNRDPASECLL
jgi:uncharacterized repeat protein (TIGR03803 family)/probable HAF family extracellular repeat protein